MAEPEKLKRETAGRYVSADGRFTVEQSSGRWLTIDGETTDELGLPLVRGPFATLDEAREAVAAARSAPPITSILAGRLAVRPTVTAAPKAPTPKPVKPREPVIEVRDVEPDDGEALRALWREAG